MNSTADTNELAANDEKVEPKTSGAVIQALEKLNQNSILLRLLWILACVILLLIAGIIIIYKLEAGAVMYITGMAAAALSLFAFHHLMKLIPQTFSILWDRKIIAYKPPKVSAATEANFHLSDSSCLENDYADYIDNLKSWMNHPGQWVMGLLFALLVFSWDYSSVIEFFIAFIIGLMAWRMAITSIKIWQFGKKFCLMPQAEHDDGCGGLEPLGNLCLWNALIVTIPGIFLGGWIIVGQSAKYSLLSEAYTFLAKSYTPLFFKLLLIPLAFAIISFFLPLWSIHRAMLISQAAKKRELDQLSYEINQLDSKLLNQVDNLDPEESEKMVKKLELMQQVYQKNLYIPIWPFNTKIIVKFMTSQAVPVLGLTGLGEPILKVIGSLVGFLS